MIALLIHIFSLIPPQTNVQTDSQDLTSYRDSMYHWQNKYKQAFIDEDHSPLKANDTAYVHFFAPNAAYKVTASLTLLETPTPFLFATSSKKEKTYQEYGTLSFTINGQDLTLVLFSIPQEQASVHLFLPFKDASNSSSTYGGGRYLDISKEDIIEGKVVLDFNKAYNPYCAFASGYNCPIPPKENHLPIEILAGEQAYTGIYKNI